MSVTEFALIQLKPGTYETIPPVLRECSDVQTRWVQENQPHLLKGKSIASHSSWFFQQETDSPCLVITAPWDSPAGHFAYIQSPDNQGILRTLSPHVAEVSGSVLLFHLNPESKETEFPGELFGKEPIFSICKLAIDASHKKTVQEKYHQLEAKAKELNPSSMVWAGWKLETDEDAEDLIIFWSQGVLDGLLDDLCNTPDAEHEIRKFRNAQ